MGYMGETLELRVAVTLDAHGGPKEDEHQQLWDELRPRAAAALRAVVEDPRYAPLRPLISGWDYEEETG